MRPGRRKQAKAGVGREPVSPPAGPRSDIWELFCRHWNPLQMEKFMFTRAELPTGT